MIRKILIAGPDPVLREQINTMLRAKFDFQSVALAADARQTLSLFQETAPDLIILDMEAETGRDGLAQAFSRAPDVILLDLGLPDMDGSDLLRQIRDYSGVPIIILTARGQEREKIANLDAGADDYLTKPFGMGELLARIRVVLRRLSPTPNDAPDQLVHFGNITLDFEKRQVWRGQDEVHLSPLEYKLLGELVKHHGKAVTHRQL